MRTPDVQMMNRVMLTSLAGMALPQKSQESTFKLQITSKPQFQKPKTELISQCLGVDSWMLFEIWILKVGFLRQSRPGLGNAVRARRHAAAGRTDAPSFTQAWGRRWPGNSCVP